MPGLPPQEACTHLKVHGELVLRHPSELQDYPVEVFGGHQLKVLDASHGNPAVEVQDVGSHLGSPSTDRVSVVFRRNGKERLIMGKTF